MTLPFLLQNLDLGTLNQPIQPVKSVFIFKISVCISQLKVLTIFEALMFSVTADSLLRG